MNWWDLNFACLEFGNPESVFTELSSIPRRRRRNESLDLDLDLDLELELEVELELDLCCRPLGKFFGPRSSCSKRRRCSMKCL
jgi:hypothetical protein